MIREVEGGIFQAVLQAVLWNRDYFLWFRFRFLQGGRCLCAGNERSCRTSSGRARGESSRLSCRTVLWNRNYFSRFWFRFLLEERCLCAGNGRSYRTSSGRRRGESSRLSCRAVLWNPNYLLRCPVSVPVPTLEKLRFRGHCPKSFSSYSDYGRICKFMLQ